MLSISSSLYLQALPDIPEIMPGCNLAEVVIKGCAAAGWQIEQGDCFGLAQKIVSKSEGRYVELSTMKPSARAQELANITGKDPRLVELVLQESLDVVRAVPGVLITRHRLGHVMANAGIDQSNVPQRQGAEGALLLPSNPDSSARQIAADIAMCCGVSVSVLINDSFGRPWRQGVCGTAIGIYGVPAIIDRRGETDRDGRLMQMTTIGWADEIAAAVSLLMGQAAEGRPVVAIRGLPFDEKAAGMDDVIRPAHSDLFR